jgi:hypothetical protein
MRFLVGLVFCSIVASAADPGLTAEERKKLVSLLEDSRDQLYKSIDGLSPAQWTFQSSPERWSVGKVVEHIMKSETLLFKKAEEALNSPPNPDWEKKTSGKTELLERVMPTRQGKAQAPFEIQPDGKMSREDVLKEFDALRAKSLAFAKQVDKPLKEYTSEHPFQFFNTLNAYQWLLYIPWHNQRHIKQIEEVKAHPEFPKN